MGSFVRTDPVHRRRLAGTRSATKRAILTGSLVLLSACASVRPTEAPLVFQAPAFGRVMCAVEEGSAFGFYPPEAPIEEDSAHLVRHVDRTVGDVLREVGTRVATLGLRGRNRLMTDHLLITEADGMLRAHLIGRDEDGRDVEPTERAIEDAQVIVSACAS